MFGISQRYRKKGSFIENFAQSATKRAGNWVASPIISTVQHSLCMEPFPHLLTPLPGSTKQNGLSEAIARAIEKVPLMPGTPLPSVNRLSKAQGVSRDTVFKAYRRLKERGLIDSTPAKGYFVQQPVCRVLVMLDHYSYFKDTFYNALAAHTRNLPVSLDLLFHYYNPDIFATRIEESLSKYNLFVVMNHSSGALHPVLNKIDPAKLILIDWGHLSSQPFSYVAQDYGEGFRSALTEAFPDLRRYQKLYYVQPPQNLHPEISRTLFAEFCRENGLEWHFTPRLTPEMVQPEQAYLIIPHETVVDAVKTCRDKALTIGKDVGILAINDTPLFEVIGPGISAISAHFEAMGIAAARFIETRNPIAQTVPTRYLRRASL